MRRVLRWKGGEAGWWLCAQRIKRGIVVELRIEWGWYLYETEQNVVVHSDYEHDVIQGRIEW